MKASLKDYAYAAFKARPMGMLVPPNWVGVTAFALLGVLSPGFWLIGAGIELGYLYLLATNPRFQRIVDRKGIAQAQGEWLAKQERLIRGLSPDEQRRYRGLESRCATILAQQAEGGAVSTDAQADGLRRLLWIYLRLLVTRQTITRVLSEAAGEGARGIEKRVEALEKQIASDGVGEDLRKSLSGQVEILRQRLEKQREARNKLAFLDAELTRIQEQAELIREQGALSADSESVSQRIDAISETLGGTMRWIGEQQKLYGSIEDILADPPPLAVPSKESQ
jgi:hypothetical protein